MRISTKLILLIGLSVVVIAFQFCVNRFINYRMSTYSNSMLQLNRVDENMLAAITEEKNFIDTHRKAAFDDTLTRLGKAQQELAGLESNPLVDRDDVTVLDGLLSRYRDAVHRLAQGVNDLDGFGNRFNESISQFNEKAAVILGKMSEEIGTKVVNTQEVPEHLRSLMDITRQVTFLMSQMYLVLNQELLLKNDMDSYIAKSGKTFLELLKEKKNAGAVSAFARNKEYSDFINDVLVTTINKLPELSAGIREAWVETTRTQGELDDIRINLTKVKGRMVLACNEHMARFETLVFWTNLLTLVFSIVIVTGLGMVILRSITHPISRITALAGQIAEGDLHGARESLAADEKSNASVDGRQSGGDEIGHLSSVFAGMTRSLHSLIGQVRNAGIQVVSSATEISASARELEATASQQAASINEVSATSREISAGSTELAKTMKEVAAVASQTASLAEEGHGELKGMESTMRQLVEATASIAEKLETISDKTNNIGSIVTTINKVADQTNLLSLNASIEAEKAGEYGLGFAVVAREIRRLADQSAVATLDIEEMVREMQSSVSSGVMEVDKFVQQVRQGVHDVQGISEQLAVVIREVQALIPQFEAVTRAMASQSTSAGEISRAMGNLSDGAFQTRQVVEEFNRAVEQLTEAVGGLQDEVSRFKVEA